MLLTKTPIGTVAYLGGLPAVLEPFCWAWGQLIQYNTEYLCQPGEYVHYAKARASLHDFARNSLVEQFLGEWLLMLDVDHVPEPDLAMRMLTRMRQYECGVLTAVYVHKFPPYSPVIYQYEPGAAGMQPIHDWDKGATAFQIGSAGAGTLLVKRWVFDRIRDELKESPFDRIKGLGEDHSFFDRLTRLKIPAFAVPTIQSPHLELVGRTLEDYHPRGRSRRRKTVQGFA